MGINWGSIFKITTNTGKVIELSAGKNSTNNSNIHFHFYIDGVFIDTIRLGNSYLTGELDATGKDISSFKFNGRAVYNVQEVFDEIPLDADELAYTNIEDYGYNKYRVSSNGSEVIINKGQFYYEGGLKDSTNNFYTGGELKKYPVIGLEKANVYIDVNIVINSDNQPVETDADGNFTISVPIGNHKIEIKKDGHTFEHTGYFPASDTFEFFENQIEPRWFIDTTRISLIGRVVGGKIQSEKPVGFGLDGEFSYVNYEGEENEENEIISSENNIGVANIILKGDLDTSTFDVRVATNPITGEYRASLIPYIYYIKSSDLKIPTNTDISILSSNETLNLLATPVLDSISFNAKDGTEFFSEAFHHKKSFRYNSPVTLELMNQEYERAIKVGESTFDISGLDKPIYLQKEKYNITFEVSQNYVNKDEAEEVITKEYYTEEHSDSDSGSNGAGLYESIGPTFSFAVGGLSFFADTETSVVADVDRSFSKSTTTTQQNVTTNSYTFNQTISTSDDKDFVGSDGDLYIGNAKNVYHDITDFELKGMASNGLLVSGIEKKSDAQYKVNVSNGNTDFGTISLQSKNLNDIKDDAGNLLVFSEFEAYSVILKKITVTADAKTKVYGETDPVLTYQITSGSLETGDVLTGGLSREVGENVGVYAISSTLLNDNYDITFVSENLSIAKKQITVTADSKTKLVDTIDPELTYQITQGNLINADDFSGNVTREVGEAIGTYLIPAGTLTLGANYNMSFEAANFEITNALNIENFFTVNQIKLYPNPIENFLNIEFGNNVKVNEIVIYSLLGKVLRKEKNVNIGIQLEHLGIGTYLVKIITNKGIGIKRIVKN